MRRVRLSLRALAAGYEPVSFLMEEAHRKQGQEFIAKYPEIPIFTAPFDVLTKKSQGLNSREGCFCAMYRRELPSIEHDV